MFLCHNTICYISYNTKSIPFSQCAVRKSKDHVYMGNGSTKSLSQLKSYSRCDLFFPETHFGINFLSTNRFWCRCCCFLAFCVYFTLWSNWVKIDDRKSYWSQLCMVIMDLWKLGWESGSPLLITLACEVMLFNSWEQGIEICYLLKAHWISHKRNMSAVFPSLATIGRQLVSFRLEIVSLCQCTI